MDFWPANPVLVECWASTVGILVQCLPWWTHIMVAQGEFSEGHLSGYNAFLAGQSWQITGRSWCHQCPLGDCNPGCIKTATVLNYHLITAVFILDVVMTPMTGFHYPAKTPDEMRAKDFWSRSVTESHVCHDIFFWCHFDGVTWTRRDVLSLYFDFKPLTAGAAYIRVLIFY